MKNLTYKDTVAACCIGYVTQAIIVNFAPLLFLIFNREFGIPLNKITILITVNFGVQLAVDLIAAKFVDKIGYRTAALIAHLFCSLGLLMLPVLPYIIPSYAGLIASTVIYAIGSGLLEVIVSPIVDSCPTDNKSSFMNLLHSFYCWGVVAVIVISTLFLFVFGKDKWKILSIIWAILPLFNFIFFIKVPIIEPKAENKEVGSIRGLIKNKIFWIFIVLMLAAGAAEQCVAQWASAFAESGLSVNKTVGDLLGACMFSVMMGSARALNAKFGKDKTAIRTLILSAILCIISYLIIVFSPYSVLSLVGCAVCGFSVGVFWPSIYSVGTRRLKGGTAMFALFALAGDMGCAVGPTVAGFIAGANGDNLKSGIIFGIVFPIIIILLLSIFSKKEAKQQ